MDPALSTPILSMHGNPLVYEVNPRLLVERLARRGGRAVHLPDVPDEYWRSLAGAGFNMVWLMGVWERSPAARRLAMGHSGLRGEYDRALPGWGPQDVDGSPYAIRRYRLDPALGAAGDLAALRAKLNGLGLGLMVDFVAGHLARDHPWTASHPDRFVQPGSADVAQRHPDWFFSDGATVLAHGRDPNFGPWTDTVQCNLFNEEMRHALAGELLAIADVADGARCDMAMLGLNEVFQPVWGECLVDRPRPATEFWAEAIAAARARHPRFVLMAEAYWGLEAKLLGLGFDFAYDKTLYDRLREGDVASIRGHLAAELVGSGRAVHFIENHDEERAVTAFGAQRSLAAATIALAVPGLRLVHDGQLEGFRAKLPVQLARGPDETPDAETARCYEKLLALIRRPVCRDGRWRLLEVEPAPQAAGAQHNLIAWSWAREGERVVVVVNYGDGDAEGFLRLDNPQELAAESLSGFPGAGARCAAAAEGERLLLRPWEACVLALLAEHDPRT